MNRRRKFLLVAAIATGIVSASAGVANAGFNGDFVNNGASPAVCMYFSGTAGDSIPGHTDCSGTHETVTATKETGECNNGVVSTTCPAGWTSGLRNHFLGDEIDAINPTNFSTFMQSHADLSLTQTTSNNQFLFVKDGDCENSTCRFISVAESSDLSNIMTVCGEGANNALKLEDTPAGSAARCDWHAS